MVNSMLKKQPSQTSLEINLLGAFCTNVGGVPVEESRWVRRSAKSLVKLLALKPHHALHREQVMDLLWAEYEPETAVNNLNKAIHGARRALEPELKKGSDSRYILTPKKQIILNCSTDVSLFVDADEFERLASVAVRNNDLEAGRKAIDLYSGDLLTEDIYDDWIFVRRESLRILYRKTATKTAELYAAAGEQQTCIKILQKLAGEDAADERVQRDLMIMLAETGSKYQALKQFEQCRAALAALGIEPEPETAKLEQSIKRGEILPAKNEFKSAPIIVSTPLIKQLTFQNGAIKSARFLPDGETIIFSADWSGGVAELYTMHLKTGEMQSTGIKNANVLSISSDGEMAIALNPKPMGFISNAILAKMQLASGKSCELLNDVQWADWHPSKNSDSSSSDEKIIAIVRDRNGESCLEFPIGNVIHKTGGWLGCPRFSPDGKKIALIEYPLWGDDRGFVVCLDLEDGTNTTKRLTKDIRISIQGLAWANDEIWFTASHQGNARIINAVNLNGEERPIYRGTGRLTLYDISKNGKVLVSDDKIRVQIAARHESDKNERDLSWHDWTLPRDLTDDGKTLLFEEAGFGGGSEFSAYVRNTDGTSTKKLAEGSALVLSPDGKYALLRFHRPHNYLALIPTEDGEIKPLEIDPSNPLTYEAQSSFFPNGKRIMFAANDIDGKRHIYIQEIDGGKPVRFKTDEEGVKMLSAHTISPDGEYAVLTNSKNRLALYKISDGKSFPLKNLDEEFYLVRWAGDGENLFIWQRREIPAVVYKYNLTTGNKEKWLELKLKDNPGGYQIVGIKLTPDGKTYAYSYMREFSDLYLMEDLK